MCPLDGSNVTGSPSQASPIEAARGFPMTTDRILGRDRPGSPAWAHVLALAGAVFYVPYVIITAGRLIIDRFL